MIKVEIVRFQDPSIRAIAYLIQFFPVVLPEVPRDHAWDSELVVVTDTGGSGEYDAVLDETLLTVEVSNPDQERASLTARTIHGLLRAWQSAEPGVYWRGTVSRPTFSPDEETRVPAYTLTVALAFRAETVQVDPR